MGPKFQPDPNLNPNLQLMALTNTEPKFQGPMRKSETMAQSFKNRVFTKPKQSNPNPNPRP